MGSFSLIVRLPFAALARSVGGDDLLVYQLGTIPCLMAAGLLGLALARRMRRRGQPLAACAAAAALCLVNPLTWEAIRLGHPEELLGGALCVGAVLAALRGRTLPAAVLLGLALATKQWAVIAVLPVLAAAPARRVSLFAVATGIALLLTVPLVLGNPASFSGATEQAAWAGERVHPFNAVWPLAPPEDRVISVGDGQSLVTVRVLPRWLAGLMHPLIVLLAVPLTVLWWRSGRRTPDDVLALLALLFLLRCLLDPVNNAYYHVPFLLSLVAWEGLTRRGPPVVSLLSAAAIYYTIYKAGWIDDIAARNALYLLATLPVGVWLAVRLYAPSPALRRRAWPAPVHRAPRRGLGARRAGNTPGHAGCASPRCDVARERGRGRARLARRCDRHDAGEARSRPLPVRRDDGRLEGTFVLRDAIAAADEGRGRRRPWPRSRATTQRSRPTTSWRQASRSVQSHGVNRLPVTEAERSSGW